MPRRRRADVTALLVALAAFVVLTVLRAEQNVRVVSVPSSYDTGRNGYAALYDFLRAEHVRVTRFEDPPDQLPSNTALLVAGDGMLETVIAARGAADVLDRWVNRGGTLIVLDGARLHSPPLGLPALRDEVRPAIVSTGCGFVPALRSLHVAGEFHESASGGCGARRAALLVNGERAYALSYRRGRGTIVYFTSPTPFDNDHLSRGDNARIAYAVLAIAGGIAFDERAHGYARGESFWQVLPPPVRWAIALSSLVLILAIIGENLPFAPPRPAQLPDERDSSAYIASVARMLEIGGTSREIVAEIGEQMRMLLRRVHANDENARNAMDEVRILESRYRPSPGDVLQAGALLARLRKEYES